MSIFLDALHCKNSGRPPVWLMRQAGRYLPEYQKIRKTRPLVDMFHHPEIICEVTQLPVDLLGVDAAIVFSDILMVLDGLNVKWGFEEGSGPVIEPAITPLTLPNLLPQFPYTPLKLAIEELKRTLSVPLIGFIGAPFTIASYLIEGKSSKDLQKTKQWLYQDPASFHQLLEIITAALIDLVDMQVAAGVDAIQIFDSWASHLSLSSFQSFCLPYMQKLLKRLKIPTILFCRGSALFAKELASLKEAACVSVDWSLPIDTFRHFIPLTMAIQGNLDPCLLFASKQVVQSETQYILNAMQGDPGFIFNLGHGVLPKTPVDNVKALIDTIKSS